MFLSDTRLAIMRASQAVAQGRLREAESQTQAALSAYGPDCGEALFILGQVRVEQGDAMAGVALMARAMHHLQPQAPLHFFYGRALVMAGDLEQAIGQFRAVVALSPAMTEAWYAMGGLQVQCGRFDQAEACYRRVLALAPGHGETRLALGGAVLEQGRGGEAEDILTAALRDEKRPDLAADMAQNMAAAQNLQGKYELALSSILLAERLGPPRRLDALRGEALAGLHRFEEALLAFQAAIAAQPHKLGLHKTYNDLLYLLGRDQDGSFLASYDQAPDTDELQQAKAGFLLMAHRHDEARDLFARLVQRNPAFEPAVVGAANALNMLGRHDEAARLLDQGLLYHPQSAGLYNMLAVTALFQKVPDKAAAMAQKAVQLAPYDQHALANLGTAWRLMADARDEALMGYDTLIRAFDLDPPQGFSSMESFNDALSEELCRLHPPAREFPDQSLRGGTQTRGALFAHASPLIQQLKRCVDRVIQAYISDLPRDDAHPLLSRRDARFAYRGSWSSRLADCGYHVNHIHPQGWISSCYYVSIPDIVRDQDARQGWIKFGEPRFDFGLGWRHALQPVAGRLVLFPSYAWHGTIPFQAPQHRLTVAFDVVPAPV